MDKHFSGQGACGAAFTLDPNAFTRSQYHWLHYRPGKVPWINDLQTSLRLPADLLVRWLVEQGPSYEAELRIGTTGHHAGVWLGIRGVGATPRHAEKLGRRGAQTLVEAAAGFHWRLHTRAAPSLPHQRVHLATAGANTRFHTAPGRLVSPQIMSQIARPGAPLLLRLRARFRHTQPELARQAGEAMDQAFIRWNPSNEPSSHDLTGGCSKEKHLIDRAEHLLEELAGLQLSFSLHSSKLPGELPLRLLAEAFAQDLQGIVRWQPEAAWVPSELDLLGDFMHLLSASAKTQRRPRPRRGRSL